MWNPEGTARCFRYFLSSLSISLNRAKAFLVRHSEFLPKPKALDKIQFYHTFGFVRLETLWFLGLGYQSSHQKMFRPRWLMMQTSSVTHPPAAFPFHRIFHFWVWGLCRRFRWKLIHLANLQIALSQSNPTSWRFYCLKRGNKKDLINLPLLKWSPRALFSGHAGKLRLQEHSSVYTYFH